MAQSPLHEEEGALQLTREYPVGCERVWRAWTDPQALSRWFGPGNTECVTRADLDVRVGGRYDIAFRTGDGQEHGVSGTYQEVAPHRRLSFTWAWKSTPERVSVVTIDLRPTPGGGTQLDFRHDRFFDRTARDNHERGWGGTFQKLDRFLRA
jgi:uncharacterized protein YndB with AHSA1/START domain